MKYLLGIDFGGGSSKATLLGENGKIIGTNTVEYTTQYPAPGYCEQNPVDWWDATCKSIKVLLSNTGINASDIECVALDAATHTAVITDKDYNVLRPAIYWTDTRSSAEVSYLVDNYSKLIDEQVFHKPGTIWTLPQLLWIKNNEPSIFAKIEHIMFAKDYVRHQLTGDYVTDNIEAEGSMLFDFTTQSWSEKLCGILGWDVSIMPKIVAPSDIVGSVTDSAALKTGLKEGTKVICGTTDTAMEVYAAGGVACGKMTIKLATAGRICVVTDKAYPDTNLINYSHIVNDLWYPGTATKSCAASYRWYRDTFGEDYSVLDSSASNIPIGAEGLIFHPYLNGELTPYQNPKLCGSFVGIRANHTKAHFTRAVLEGVALSMLDCKGIIDNLGIEHDLDASIIGGGGKSPLWCQIIADVLDIKLCVYKYSDSSFGSAMLAGVSSGIFASVEEAFNICNEKLCEVTPNPENHKIYMKLFTKYKKIQSALSEVYDD